MPTAVFGQNYFWCKNAFCRPKKGIAVGSPISCLIIESCLQHTENKLMKLTREGEIVICYPRYICDIVVVTMYNTYK